MPSNSALYKADLAGVALKPTESQVIAAWMLSSQAQSDPEGSWQTLIYEQNEVQIRGRSTLRRQSNLIKNRLSHLILDELKLLVEGTYAEMVQVCFVAAVRHSRFLGDFVQDVVGGLWKRRQKTLTTYEWKGFLETCRAKDTLMGDWSSATEHRIKTTVMTILKEVGLVKKLTEYEIQHFVPEASVVALLGHQNDTYCLGCLGVTQ
jgi:hypothetical protein